MKLLPDYKDAIPPRKVHAARLDKQPLNKEEEEEKALLV
jgi:hypothetical protein